MPDKYWLPDTRAMMVALEKALTAMERDSEKPLFRTGRMGTDDASMTRPCLASTLPGHTHRCNAVTSLQLKGKSGAQARPKESSAGSSSPCAGVGEGAAGGAAETRADGGLTVSAPPRALDAKIFGNEEGEEVGEMLLGGKADATDRYKQDLSEPINMMIHALVLLR